MCVAPAATVAAKSMYVAEAEKASAVTAEATAAVDGTAAAGVGGAACVYACL